ncbi:contactin-2-like [Mizuhopecten yessoensis]|uniref:Peroxidasin-like n=1 Tax=Mizuhopecten yessoensis TaxID=6573 RepID=A0A210QGR8_MIZYE|nr:contactin-2-like [Mizuhopecten yessoensis]XP_021358539.1 contactin-2-like [Mizuhopecten yessoensis]XP_021358540.1 contactin-2-like [Mizuhopecten yessoensis]XP_021358541.1 contactin-2-like [Mizuhopecten yessoensis]OWF47942.1 Peroxidasin-like [Mizuhopecten yessoensis]
MAGWLWNARLWNEETTYDVNERMSVTLKCKCNSITGTVKWIHGNQTYSQCNNDSNYEVKWINNELSLKIKCVAESDGGEYFCEVRPNGQFLKSQAITVNVWNILRYPKTIYTVPVCRPIKLTCVVKHPKLSTAIYWMHNAKPINLESGRHTVISEPSTSLKIDKVCTEDAGTYECRVSGIKYPSQHRPNNSVLLEVLPEVIILKNKYVAQIHSKVTFDCKIYGADDCTWNHNGKSISSCNNRFTINEDMSLTISPVQQSDAGRYVCEITNFRTNKSATSQEVELCTTSSEFSKGYSEYFQPSESQEMEEDLIKSLSAKIPDNKACFWFIGQYGAGKSSAISSFLSWRDSRISTLALPGKSQGSFTTKVSSAELLGGKVTLYDFPGLEGNIADKPDQFSYKHFDDITKCNKEGDSLKCCVVYVLDSSDKITACDITRMQHFKKYTKDRENLQMVVLLTKIDKASQSAATVREMLESQEVCKVTQQIHDAVGVPLNCIFAIYNYHKQMERDSEMNLLILHTFRSLLERLLDIYARLDSKKVVPT